MCLLTSTNIIKEILPKKKKLNTFSFQYICILIVISFSFENVLFSVPPRRQIFNNWVDYRYIKFYLMEQTHSHRVLCISVKSYREQNTECSDGNAFSFPSSIDKKYWWQHLHLWEFYSMLWAFTIFFFVQPNLWLHVNITESLL